MNTCKKCSTVKELYARYNRGRTATGTETASFSAGSACPKCEPHRVGVETEPAWWKKFFEKAARANTTEAEAHPA